MLRDICNLYMYFCASSQNLREYEERLLDKCFDNEYDIHVGSTMAYEPPLADIKNTENM